MHFTDISMNYPYGFHGYPWVSEDNRGGNDNYSLVSAISPISTQISARMLDSLTPRNFFPHQRIVCGLIKKWYCLTNSKTLLIEEWVLGMLSVCKAALWDYNNCLVGVLGEQFVDV